MNFKNLMPLLGIVLFGANAAIAQNDHCISQSPNGNAPISVMGDHSHKKGGFMFTFRSMSMGMDGNLQSSKEISNEKIYQNYRVAPQKMNMYRQMLSIMYAPTDQITLMAMGNYTSNTMDLQTKMGLDFTTKSQGFGDVKVVSLITLMNRKRHSLHSNIGISIPTGSIEKRDATPMMNDAPLAYPMQLGSGTWDPSLGLTYLGQAQNFSWGAQSIYTLRLGENSKNYSLGNRINMVSWVGINASDYFSLSTSVSFFSTQKIKGADADLNPMMMPLFSTANSGRSQLDIGLGTNFLIPKSSLKNLRLAAELKIPAYQKVNGIQMKNTLMAIFGIQYTISHKG